MKRISILLLTSILTAALLLPGCNLLNKADETEDQNALLLLLGERALLGDGELYPSLEYLEHLLRRVLCNRSIREEHLDHSGVGPRDLGVLEADGEIAAREYARIVRRELDLAAYVAEQLDPDVR